MVVQLNQKNTDEMTAQETVSRLLRMLENQEPMLEFSQQQYFSPIYSREWYKTQVVRRTFDLLGYSWASCPDFWAIPLILIFCLLLILSAILAVFLTAFASFFCT
ncbi:hypothetical protein MIS45_05930 [Wielerella bovis]|uniref:hypothetical protein n=1 Tax=Wielerella bovis TaxID=2917790 RepID=UPI002018D72F|nr:hypothetical protein [Wielerella bovis]ULJ68353.1 hypothetical protein MIS45_05930 [Wielerella bovis]